ncbi:MAG: hypothetical protein AB1779_09380 [Candidatus Thermoplasmatota archaeon]
MKTKIVCLMLVSVLLVSGCGLLSANKNNEFDVQGIKQIDNEIGGYRGTGTKGDGTSVTPPLFSME